MAYGRHAKMGAFAGNDPKGPPQSIPRPPLTRSGTGAQLFSASKYSNVSVIRFDDDFVVSEHKSRAKTDNHHHHARGYANAHGSRVRPDITMDLHVPPRPSVRPFDLRCNMHEAS